MSIRTSAAIATCKATHRVMRLMGRTARAMPGAVALKVDPRLIDKLSRGHKTIVITGTNGKTTTTHIVQQAVINAYGTAAYDPSSTNLEQGIATTLCLDSTIGGKRKSVSAVIGAPVMIREIYQNYHLPTKPQEMDLSELRFWYDPLIPSLVKMQAAEKK